MRLPFQVKIIFSGLILLLFATDSVRSQSNAIVAENALPGNPRNEWDISDASAGDLSIQGFADGLSVNKGETVHFKIDVSDAAEFNIKIYRLGYYDGDGARLITDLGNFTGVNQPDPVSIDSLGLKDCGNWSESASWAVPATAVSGVYIAKLTRTGNGGASHIAFIVRDDGGGADMLFKTSDGTWQAYNGYGGNSLYTGNTAFTSGHAPKVSYNRPFITRNGGAGGGAQEDWLFNAEYPMIRFLERNGYDISYTTDLDMERDPKGITPDGAGGTYAHKVLLSVGHDEYWSGAERAKWEAARDAGVHLAFFSGNEVYWKTRWENSIDGNDTPVRTLVCYKEGTLGENVCYGNCDPTDVWTGLWRDGCGSQYGPPYSNDGCNPENSLTGQISWDGTTYAIAVPDAYKDLRFWRNTSIATLGAGQSVTFPFGTLGYEWDWEQYFDSYPPARILLSEVTYGNHTHKLSLYANPSGALVFGAGTCQWSWGLDEVHDRGNEPVNQDMQQATVNLFADMGVQPTTLQSGLTPATASTDVTAPVSIITSPTSGSEFAANSQVTITGTASDMGGVLAGVDVSVDGGNTWKVATGTSNWTFTFTPEQQGTITVLSHGFDDSGNIEPSGSAPADNAIELTITAPVAPICPCSIWDPSTVPGLIDDGDSQAIEVGVKFRSNIDGYITGIRFYKSPNNTGSHIGNLWTTAGTNLASASFSNETASGWQEVLFGAPVQITSGTTYIASYHTTSGYYSADVGYFATNGYSSYYLEALADGEDGVNGVYTYSGSSTFPSDTYNSSNYWVDVVFETEIGPDVTPPVVVSTSPTNGATSISINTNITANFSESLDMSTVNTNTVILKDPLDATVAGTVSLNGNVVTFDPDASLDFSTTYTLTLKGDGGYNRIKDLAGNALFEDYVFSFTTDNPPPVQGPGGPILVVHSASNPFGLYTIEMLRAEGFNEFLAMDISEVTSTVLSNYDVVILGECAVDAGFVTDITNWVDAGGILVAFRPDSQLSGLFGLTSAGGTLSEAYLLVNTASGPGVGIVDETIQYHGTADHYTLNGAISLATLYSDATTATIYPAVTENTYGSNNGKAFAFSYDLSKSIVLTRQGNPAWSGQNRETNDGVIRSNDLFYGNAAGDPQPDWVNLDKVEIPQADEQMHLLSNIIVNSSLHKKPLPRFWFLPNNFKAAVVMTGDDHGTGLTTSFFDSFITASGGNNTAQDVLDWTAIRTTSYIYDDTPITNADSYESQGFEISIHVNTGCNVWTPASMEADYAQDLLNFSNNFPNLDPPATHRTHCIAWSDYVTQPKVEVNHGIRLDVNYYYWPGDWILDRPGMFTGSGMPMRFADLDGSFIDCYQVTTQMTDESGQSYPLHWQSLIDKAAGPEGYYGVFCANFHTDRNSSLTLANNLINYAKTKNVPVISAKQMLTWLDARNGSAFENIAWNTDELSFSVNADPDAINLIGMIPYVSDNGALVGLTQNGSPVSYSTETIKGIEYAMFPAESGNFNISYGTDDVGPVISNIIATPEANGTATITWTTSEASDSQVDYDVVDDPLSISAYDATPVTAHSVTLTGLLPNTTYYFRVTSADAFSNSTTDPNPPAVPLEFSTPTGICAQDQTDADFNQGTTDANTLVVLEGDGSVILNPTLNEEFSGTTIPTGWTPEEFNPGGGTTVGSGQVTVNGTHLYSDISYGPGSSIEFVATFNLSDYQNVGLSNDQPFDTNPWVTIGQGQTADGNLYARTSDNTNISLGSDLLGSSHKYRIQWNTSNFKFYVDDNPTPSATINLTISTPMFIQISDVHSTDGTLSVDWIRMAPFAGGGTYTSRIFNQGTPNGWGEITWNSTEPTGTSIAMSVRTGDVAAPDETWTSWIPVSNDLTIGGSHQYIQYKAELATTNDSFTPVLEDVSITCGDGPDITPPVISNVVASPGLDGMSATITWTTDEATNSTVYYGTDAGDLSETVSDATLVISHSLLLTGLTSETTYYFRVESEDLSTNSTTEPTPPATLNFTTLVEGTTCLLDQTAADFGSGTTTDTYISITGDGEVIINPTLGEEFTATALPAGWQAGPWQTGGTVNFAGGYVVLNCSRIGTTGSYGPGTSIEFAVTFTADASENIGFSIDFDFNAPYVTIGTGTAGDGIYARADGVSDISILPSSEFGNPHTFRIDWNTSSFDFFVDNATTPAATITKTVGNNMYVLISDHEVTLNATSFSTDWLRILPFTTSGTFESGVYNGGSPRNWIAASWNADLPAGTSLDIFIRKGDTPAPDGTWTSYTQVTNGEAVGSTSQYIQYKAVLATTDPRFTPVLQDIEITCEELPDLSPPVITNVAAAPDPGGTLATITWNTDEVANSLVEYGTDPGNLSEFSSDAGYVLAHSLSITGLTPGITYYYRVTSEDASSNPSTEPDPPAAPLSFNTPAQPCFIDDGATDYESGTFTDTYLSLSDDGVILQLSLASEFIELPPATEWQSFQWSGGTSTVSGGILTVNGARFNSVPEASGVSVGSTMEFVATFGTASNQHIGLAGGTDATGPGGIYWGDDSWAMFSTYNTGGISVYARCYDGSSFKEYDFGGTGLIGSSHLYRIVWNTNSVDFYVDDNLVHSEIVTITGTMRPAISDYDLDGTDVKVDWIHVSPYASTGIFESQVFDGTEVRQWDNIYWSTVLPTGTAIDMYQRMGNTAIPDVSWSSFSPIAASGDDIPGKSRYIQYKAELGTSDPNLTPVLNDVSIYCTETPAIDIALYHNGCGDFEVRAKPNADFLSNYLTNIQFTVKWPDNTVSLTNVNSSFGIGIQGSVVVENDTNYAIFASTAYTPIDWIAGTEYTILTFSHDHSGAGTANFEIDEGSWSSENNGMYYAELLGTDYSGTVYAYGNADNVYLGRCLDIKVFLQGPYTGGGLMTTGIGGNIPLSQPYNTDPWNYTGTESVTEMDGTLTDWVLVELRSDINTITDQKAGLLMEDGKIVQFDQIDQGVHFDHTPDGSSYYIVIYHRNHMPVMTAFSTVFDGTLIDFTDESISYGAPDAEIELETGIFGMIAGDINNSGVLQYSGPGNDRGEIIAQIINQGGEFITSVINDGYWPEDINLNNELSYIGGSNDRSIIIDNLIELNGTPYLNNIYTSVVPGIPTKKSTESIEGPLDIELIENNQIVNIDLIANKTVENALVDNIQFTLAWHAENTEIQELMSIYESEFNLLPQGNPQTQNNTSYQIFASVRPVELPQMFETGDRISVISFTNNEKINIAGQLWIADDEFTRENNGMYYISNWGKNATGAIHNSSMGIDMQATNNFRIYPNPVTQNQLNIKADIAPDKRFLVKIADVNGKVNKLSEYRSLAGKKVYTIDVSNLKPGVYSIQLMTNDHQYMDRFIIK